MKKRIILLVAALVMAFTMTGCGENEIPELSDTEMYQVEEYAAQLLLKYNKFYDDGTISAEEIAKQEDILDQIARSKAIIEQQKENQAVNDTSSTEDVAGSDDSETIAEVAPVYQDIDEFLGLSSFDIECTGYMICDRYPTETTTNDWQGVAKATNGNKLVAINMTVTNKTDDTQSFDMASMDARASVVFNGSIRKAPITTLLLNDFMMYRGNIAARESVELVILVEVSEDNANNIQAGVLTFKCNGAKMETTIL